MFGAQSTELVWILDFKQILLLLFIIIIKSSETKISRTKEKLKEIITKNNLN